MLYKLFTVCSVWLSNKTNIWSLLWHTDSFSFSQVNSCLKSTFIPSFFYFDPITQTVKKYVSLFWVIQPWVTPVYVCTFLSSFYYHKNIFCLKLHLNGCHTTDNYPWMIIIQHAHWYEDMWLRRRIPEYSIHYL